MVATAELARPRIFYGWWLVASLSTIMFLSAGFGFYAIGVFITPLQDSFGWTRGQISFAIALIALCNGLTGPIIGILVDRVGPRAVMAGGAAIMALALMLLSLTWSLFSLYPLFMLTGIGQAGIMLVPITAVVSNWFEQKRGLAMGLTTAGIGLGGLVMAPLTALLIAGIGWRATFLVMGIVVAVVALPVALLVIRHRPQDSGLLPDGRLQEGATLDPPMPPESEADSGWTARKAIRTRAFIALAVAFSLTMSSVGAVLLHLVPFLEDRGMSREGAALMLGFISGMGVFGKIGSGYLTDRFSPRVIASAVFVLLAVGLSILLRTDSIVGMAAFTVVFGYAMGSVVALQPLAIVHCFGVASATTVLGASGAIVWTVDAFGPMVAGVGYDIAGTYTPVFITFAVMDCLAAALILLFGRPPERRTT